MADSLILTKHPLDFSSAFLLDSFWVAVALTYPGRTGSLDWSFCLIRGPIEDSFCPWFIATGPFSTVGVSSAGLRLPPPFKVMNPAPGWVVEGRAWRCPDTIDQEAEVIALVQRKIDLPRLI